MFTINHPCIELYRQLLAGSGHEDLIVDSSYVFASRKASTLNVDAGEWLERKQRGTPLEVVTGDELREMEPAVAPDFERAILQKAHGRVTNPGRLVKVLAEQVFADGGEYLQADVLDAAPRSGHHESRPHAGRTRYTGSRDARTRVGRDRAPDHPGSVLALAGPGRSAGTRS